jgi:hypothetical protein
MIDWFASKIGMLVFVTVIFSVLLGFVAMESSAFEFEQRVRMTEDMARLIDVVDNGGFVTYESPVQKYELTVNSAEKYVSIDGIVRHFLADSSDASIADAPQLTIENVNGVVNVTA